MKTVHLWSQVGLSVTLVSPAKTAEQIETPSGGEEGSLTQVGFGPRKRVTWGCTLAPPAKMKEPYTSAAVMRSHGTRPLNTGARARVTCDHLLYNKNVKVYMTCRCSSPHNLHHTHSGWLIFLLFYARKQKASLSWTQCKRVNAFK